MRKFALTTLAAICLFAAFVYLNNSSLLTTPGSRAPVLLAHRGLAQTFGHKGLDANTCTAARIDPPEHPYLENTLASMEAAFRAGADVVEFDIHPTIDGKFAVFHDWTLPCRTDGKGVTREHTLAELKALDVGYGYTADGGKTYPFRGKGVGLLPSLDEVLAAFPGKRFLINIKSNDPTEGANLAERLQRLAPDDGARLMAYGGNRPIDALHARLPAMPVGSNASLKRCLLGYLLTGWVGHVPPSCRMGLMLVPLNVAPWLWGWPGRFLARMQAAGVHVFVVGPYDGSFGTSGTDVADQLSALPEGFVGGIWTNRIDRIGAALGRKPR